MGDAGPTAAPGVDRHGDPTSGVQQDHGVVREVHVLVTGFGPFRSFTTNPSFMIASSLPTSLDPADHAETIKRHKLTSLDGPLRPALLEPYKIIIHTHPDPITVAYASTATLIPKLVSSPVGRSAVSVNPPAISSSISHDYIFHIGMAAGRDNYTLETLAHRDHYKIKDVDDQDGFSTSEHIWKPDCLPSLLNVGWNKQNVLQRWEAITNTYEDQYQAQETSLINLDLNLQSLTEEQQQRQETRKALFTKALLSKDNGKRAEVKLSADAGRYLCEFILYTSLSTRWKQARDSPATATSTSTTPGTTTQEPPSRTRMRIEPERDTLQRDLDLFNNQRAQKESEARKAKIGKVAFLHVPGGTTSHDIARGTRVAEAAILAVVSSWEEGYRNPEVYSD